MLCCHTRVGLYHLFFPDIFPLMPVTALHQHHMKDLAFQQISEFLVIFFSTIRRDGINKFCFPCLPQIHSIPKGKVNLNIYKLSRLLIMINITTSRAEMLQNVTHVNTESIQKYMQGKVWHHPPWGSCWSLQRKQESAIH